MELLILNTNAGATPQEPGPDPGDECFIDTASLAAICQFLGEEFPDTRVTANFDVPGSGHGPHTVVTDNDIQMRDALHRADRLIVLGRPLPVSTSGAVTRARALRGFRGNSGGGEKRCFGAGLRLPALRYGWLHPLLQHVMQSMQYASFADRSDAQAAHALGVTKLPVLVEPAFALAAAGGRETVRILARHSAPVSTIPLMGVVPRAHRLKEELKLPPERYLLAMTRTLDALADNHATFPLFMPLDAAGERLCNTLAERMTSSDFAVLPVLNPARYKAICSRLSLMLTGHRGSALMAASAGVSVIGLDHGNRLAPLLEDLQRPHQRFDVDLLCRAQLSHQLAETIEAQLNRRKPDAAAIESVHARMRTAIRRWMQQPSSTT